MQKKFRKIVALLCAIMLCVNSAQITTKASDISYTGSLSADITTNSQGTNADATKFYMIGTDSFPLGGKDGWDSTIIPTDDVDSGIFINGKRINNYYYTSSDGAHQGYVRFRKYADNRYYIEKIPNIQIGDVLTIKGTFYVYGSWKDPSVFEFNPIVFEASSFRWTGSEWQDCYSGKILADLTTNSQGTNADATKFYMKGTDSFPLGGKNGWDSTIIPIDDVDSGIFINGERINDYYYVTEDGTHQGHVWLRKHADNSYYIEKIPNIQIGDVLTIKGTFYVYGSWKDSSVFEQTPVVYEESSFLWTGSQWIDYYVGSFSVQTGQVVGENNNNHSAFYLGGTDGFKIGVASGDWAEYYYVPMTTEDGITLDGVRQNSYYYSGNESGTIKLRKYYDTDYFFLEGIGTPTEVVIEGLFYVYGPNSALKAVVDVEGSMFQWNGSYWVDVKYYPGKLSLDTATNTGTNFDATKFYMKGTDSFPLEGKNGWDSTIIPIDDANSGIFINGERINDYYYTTTDGAHQGHVWLRKHADNSYYIEKIPNIQIGDVLTIKGTFYVYGSWKDSSVFEFVPLVFQEVSFCWTGSQWTDYYIGSFSAETGQVVGPSNNNQSAFYLGGTDKFEVGVTTGEWANYYYVPMTEADGIILDGVRQTSYYYPGNESGMIKLRKYYDTNLFYIEGIGTPTEVAIEGKFVVYGANATQVATVKVEASNMKWNGAYWTDYVPSANYTGTPVFSTGGNCGDENGFYFTSEDGAPYDKDWNLKFYPADGDTNGVFVNGEKKDIFLKKFDTNHWYVCVSEYRNEQEPDLTFSYGDIVTIKGAFTIGDTNDTVTFNEATFEFNGRHFGQGTFSPVDIEVTGLNYKSINYDETNGVWNLYFTLNSNIEGNANDVYFPYMAYEVNGTEYMTHWWKSSDTYTVNEETYYSLYMTIPKDVLPQPLAEDTEYTITLKAGASQGRNNSSNTAREDGIRLTKDFSFKVGTDHTASAPAIDYVTASGGTVNGIYLSSSDDFPVTGWDAQLKKVGNGGIYKYDSNSGTYVETEVFIKKYTDGKYYVCLSDVDEHAAEGTIVMLKGTFSFVGLYDVTFKTAKYIYSNGTWQTYTATTDTEVEVEWYGDATGDAEKVEDINSVDLVRIKRYIAGEIEVIQSANADLNSSGNIDEHDAALERWLLVNGATYFVNGSNIQGVPIYEDDQEMRLAAYISPELSDDQGFQWYKEAGFTTLMGEGENRAVYGTDELDAYMKKAESYGLDVLVRSSAIQDMLAGTLDVNAAQIESVYNDLSTTYGDTFRGLFLWDEPRYSHLEDHIAVLNTLNSLNADTDKDMYTACLPIYTEDDTCFWNDNSLSLNEKYTNYANAYGTLFGEYTYDFYPFRHKYSSFLGIKYNEDDYMRSDWFNNLEIAASAGHGKFENGIVVQSYAENENDANHYRDITEADVSFQVYSALAYGMKSIQYFTYGEHWDTNVHTTNCMIYDGQKTAIYDAVKAVNTEIKKIDHILLNYNWQGTIGISGDDEDNIMDSVVAYTSPRILKYSAKNDAIIGCLKDVNGYDGFMLVNATDPAENKAAVEMSVKFDYADHAKVYIDGVENIIELTEGEYNVTLNPGQGIFVIPYIGE